MLPHIDTEQGAPPESSGYSLALDRALQAGRTLHFEIPFNGRRSGPEP